MTRPPQLPPALLLPALLLVALLPACASTSEPEGEPYEPPTLDDGEQPIGPYLTELSIAIAEWTALVTVGTTRQDRQKIVLLTEVLARRADERFDDLVDQLQVGPPVNREIAAAALGFSRREEALAPLVAALEDPDPEVVRNALLGLYQLRDPRTPLQGVVDALRFADDLDVRGNAATALRVLISEVQVPHDPEAVSRVARSGITDPSPIVRSQCALILAALVRTDAIEPLEALLADEAPLVAAAAARALAYIGTRDVDAAGACARALAGALPGATNLMRGRLLENLKALRASISDGIAFEDLPEEWLRWSHGLP